MTELGERLHRKTRVGLVDAQARCQSHRCAVCNLRSSPRTNYSHIILVSHPKQSWQVSAHAGNGDIRVYVPKRQLVQQVLSRLAHCLSRLKMVQEKPVMCEHRNSSPPINLAQRHVPALLPRRVSALRCWVHTPVRGRMATRAATKERPPPEKQKQCSLSQMNCCKA